MIVVAKTLGIMHLWGLYFWVSLVITYVVTATDRKNLAIK